jgi:site-specific recombinase XerD
MVTEIMNQQLAVNSFTEDEQKKLLIFLLYLKKEQKKKKAVRKSGLKYLSLNEQKLLMKTIRETKGKKAERDLVIVDLILNTGLRVSEAVGLTIADVRNKEKLYVRPEIAKRSKGRFIPLNKHIQDVLRHFMKLKLSLLRESINDESNLFISKKKNPLSKRSLQNVIEFWMLKTGLTTTRDGRIVPLYSVHSLRHTCFKRMRERGIALEVIQKLAGHSSLASTGIYCEATYEEMESAVNIL